MTNETLKPIIKELKAANEAFLQKSAKEGLAVVDKYPKRNLVILTCMDTRLVNFLEPALGLERGDAKIIKVAGNTVSDGFDSVLGSLLVAVYELKAHTVLVVGHEGCGMLATTGESLCAKMAEAGIDETAIKELRPYIETWADSIKCVEDSTAQSVRKLKECPYLPAYVNVCGCVINPHTGAVSFLEDL